MSFVKFFAKLKNLNFWQIFQSCNFDSVLFWLGIWYESIVWVIMGRQGFFSQHRHSSSSSYAGITQLSWGYVNFSSYYSNFMCPSMWKRKKMDYFMCLLEFECAKWLKTHSWAIPGYDQQCSVHEKVLILIRHLSNGFYQHPIRDGVLVLCIPYSARDNAVPSAKYACFCRWTQKHECYI